MQEKRYGSRCFSVDCMLHLHIRVLLTTSIRRCGISVPRFFCLEFPFVVLKRELKVAPDTDLGNLKMSKIYFNDKISEIPLLITESYIQYGSEIIPTNAVSYFSIKRINVSWLLAILLLLAGAILFFCDGDLSSVGLVVFFVGTIDFIVTYLRSKKRFITISSHSKHCIQIEIGGNQYQQFYKPLTEALISVVEDNNNCNLKALVSEDESTSH